MAASLWEDLKKNVKAGVSTAAEKTEEYTKIGKLKVEILNTNRNLEKGFADIGREVHNVLTAGKKLDPLKNETFKELIEKVNALKADVQAKEKEIEQIRIEYEDKGIDDLPVDEEADKSDKKSKK